MCDIIPHLLLGSLLLLPCCFPPSPLTNSLSLQGELRLSYPVPPSSQTSTPAHPPHQSLTKTAHSFSKTGFCRCPQTSMPTTIYGMQTSLSHTPVLTQLAPHIESLSCDQRRPTFSSEWHPTMFNMQLSPSFSPSRARKPTSFVPAMCLFSSPRCSGRDRRHILNTDINTPSHHPSQSSISSFMHMLDHHP